MARPSPPVEHLLRRAGFGMTPAEQDRFSQYTYPMAVSALTNYDPAETGVDHLIGTPGYVGIFTRAGGFAPNTNIEDSRQRWLFRMVHSPAPLQEKMTLFWHHHFATAYSKLNGLVGNIDATRMMAAVPAQDPNGARGQIELLRDSALGNFRQLLVDVAKDIAMLVLARRPAEHATGAAGELRPRADGAVHVRRRALHRAGRLRRGPRLHRLVRRPRHRERIGVLELQLQRRQSRREREDVQLRHHARQQDDSGAAGGVGDAGRYRPDQRARDSSRDAAAARAPAVDLVRERGRAARSGLRRFAVAASTWTTTPRSSR